MSKQKIILIIIFVLILLSFVIFIFFLNKENKKIEELEIPTNEPVKLKTNEEILNDLESFQKPTKEINLPYSARSVDPSILTDEEIKQEINTYKPEVKKENNLTDQQILQLLENPDLAN